MAQRRGQRTLLVEAQHLGEPLQLQAGVGQVRRLGVGQVGEDALDSQVTAAERRFQQRFGAVPVHADPFHAGVDLQMHPGGAPHRRRVLLDGPQLVHRRRGQRQVVLEEAGDLRADDAPQHQHRQLHAVLAQPQALFQVGHAENGGSAGSRRGRRPTPSRAPGPPPPGRGHRRWPSGWASPAPAPRGRRLPGSWPPRGPGPPPGGWAAARRWRWWVRARSPSLLSSGPAAAKPPA